MPELKDKLEEINSQIESATEDTQAKWQGFEQARDEFAASGAEASNTESEEFKKAHEANKEYGEASDRLAGLQKTRDGIFAMIANEKPEDHQIPERTNSTTETPSRVKTLGQRAAESEDYKQLVASGALSSERANFTANLGELSIEEQKAEFSGFSGPQAALITGAGSGSGGAFTVPDRQPYVPQPRQPLKIVNLITTGQTGSDSVQYARQDAFTNVAAETAEAAATTMGTKPEATITFTKVTATVRTIAHWVPATRRALADVPQMQTLIDSQLRYGLALRLETQVVNGGGTGEDLTGILNTANILTQAKGSDSNEDAIFKGITQIRLGFVEPNGIGVHPNNWQTIRLNKASTAGTYLLGGPAVSQDEMLWGLPVAVTPAVPANTGLVGDFRYATLWLREAAQVLASDSHSDFFVKNLVAILAEMRAAFGVTIPAAFCKITSMT